MAHARTQPWLHVVRTIESIPPHIDCDSPWRSWLDPWQEVSQPQHSVWRAEVSDWWLLEEKHPSLSEMPVASNRWVVSNPCLIYKLPVYQKYHFLQIPNMEPTVCSFPWPTGQIHDDVSSTTSLFRAWCTALRQHRRELKRWIVACSEEHVAKWICWPKWNHWQWSTHEKLVLKMWHWVWRTFAVTTVHRNENEQRVYVETEERHLVRTLGWMSTNEACA